MGMNWQILADRADWQRLGDRFQSRQEITWETWLGLLAPILLFGILAAVGKWWVDRGASRLETGQRALFRELAAAHGLTWYDRWLLTRLARACELAHPVHVFLDPRVYQNQEAAQRLARVWPRILKLESRLFAEPAGN